MPHAQPEEHLICAAAAVEEAARLLARPDAAALERSSEELATACSCLSLLVDGAPASQPAWRIPVADELAGLSRSLARARGLLEHGEAFWVGWARVRNALTAGYTASGEPAAPAAPDSRFSVEG